MVALLLPEVLLRDSLRRALLEYRAWMKHSRGFSVGQQPALADPIEGKAFKLCRLSFDCLRKERYLLHHRHSYLRPGIDEAVRS